MSTIDPASCRTELCLAIDGRWFLMRDGGVIAVLPAAPEDQPVTDVVKARVWANDQLARRGISAGAWVNGMEDRPPADSGYWVTEPWEDAAGIAVPANGVAS